MATPDPDATVAALALERPERTRIFELLDIDYCCGGGVRLRDACSARGLDLATVLSMLECDVHAESECFDYVGRTLPELVEHIETCHHAFLRRELPRLSGLAEKVVRAHASARPGLRDLAETFELLRSDLCAHLDREEQELFPVVRAGRELPEALRAELPELIGEHAETGRLLREIRALAGDFRLEHAACMTHRALLDGLRELELDVHRHVFEENSVLFPRLDGSDAGEASRSVAAA